MNYEYRDFDFLALANVQDTEGFFRPSAYLNFFQQAGGLHVEEYNLGNPVLLKRGIAWVVSKNHVKVLKNIPHIRRVLTRTWPQREEKISCIRNYELFFKDELIAVGTSKWCILDMVKKLPSRIPQDMFPLPHRDENPFKEEFFNIPTENKDELQFLKNMEVWQIFCDTSHHLNNANYMEFVFEALKLEDKYIEEFQIDYINQCYKGSNLEIYKKDLENGFIYVAGYVGETLIFKSWNKLCKI